LLHSSDRNEYPSIPAIAPGFFHCHSRRSGYRIWSVRPKFAGKFAPAGRDHSDAQPGGRLLAEDFGLRPGGGGAATQQFLGLACSPAAVVVPSSQILNVMHARLRSWYPVEEFRRPHEQGVPGEVQGTLDSLSSEVRQTTASFDDCAYQAGCHHRVAGHLLDVVSIDRPDPACVVAICKPAVLQPASVYQVGCVVENTREVIKLGEPRADLVAEPKLS
jgi:hypothetical protein